MAKVQTVEKAQKDQGECGKCTKKIKKGDSYRWWKHRFGGGGKRVRCMDANCRPRQSELTTSDKLSRVYAVAENVEDAIAAFRDSHEVEDLKSACTDGAEELRAVAEEYRESAQNIEDGFNGNRVPMCDELEEKADHLDGVADELESAGDNLPELESEEDAEPTDEEIREAIEAEVPEESLAAHVLTNVCTKHGAAWEGLKDEEKGKLIEDETRRLMDEKHDEICQERKEKADELMEEWIDEVAQEVEGVSIEPA
jgi:hypothetical protein